MTTARGGGEQLARVIFALLVLASFAAFFVTQRLKHTPTVVQEFQLTPFFSPTPQGHLKQEQISFKIAHPDRVTVTIIDLTGDEIATLAKRQRLAAYTHLSLLWSGREGTAGRGRKAPEGEYRVEVDLLGQKRIVRSPTSFKLVRHISRPAGG